MEESPQTNRLIFVYCTVLPSSAEDTQNGRSPVLEQLRCSGKGILFLFETRSHYIAHICLKSLFLLAS